VFEGEGQEDTTLAGDDRGFITGKDNEAMENLKGGLI